MFEVGEKVVYPNHGVSVVEEISTASFHEADQTLFHLRLLSNNSKVMVPKENLELVGLRRLCDKGEIQELIDTLQDGHIDTYKDWKGRYKQNLDKMKTGRLTEVAEVLKNLCLVSQKKSLSFREKKMYERAKYFIVSEVAQVRDIEDEEAESLVEASLESSLEKLRTRQAAKREADGDGDADADPSDAAAAKTKAASDAGQQTADEGKGEKASKDSGAPKAKKKAAAAKPAAKKTADAAAAPAKAAAPKKAATSKRAAAKKPATKKPARRKAG